MKLIRKLTAPKEVRHVFKLLDEADHKFDCPAFELVRDPVETNILSMADDIAKEVRNGTATSRGDPCVHILYIQIANVSGDYLSSGDYHLHRGILNPKRIGSDLLRIFDGALDELLNSGYMDEREAKEQKDGIREQIKQVG